MMKSSSKVSQLIKDDIQSKIIQIYKSVDPEINTFYYTRKINELIKDFNQNINLGKKEDICSEKTILLICYADNLVKRCKYNGRYSYKSCLLERCMV